uniref:Knr4/Smi1-like domain-containing protein n=1 Tax=Shewanella putrefaciens (strain CN-32 / ATCC BAA-453) TaxID=319224 RepID=A4Y3K0_SHEPC
MKDELVHYISVIAKESAVAFDLSEEQLKRTEEELGAKLPHEYREAMKIDNGGEASTEEDDWEFYPIKDISNRKRLSRTCNHIINETESCQGFGYFPESAITIAGNGFGDQMVFLKEGESFGDTVYLWLHETGELQQLAGSFSEIKKR